MILDVAVGVLTAMWFGLSVANQFHRGKVIGRVKRRDVFALIPTWTFFAPRPGTTDFRVMYRDCSLSGGFSRWLEMREDRPGPLRAVWNPAKRAGKGTTDMCNTLLRMARQDLGKRIYLQIPYLTLLNYVSAAPRTEVSHLRQFAIVRTSGHDAPRDTALLFVSALHRF